MNLGPSIEELPGPKVQVISPTPLRPINTSNIGRLDEARTALGNLGSSVATILRFNKDTLRALCDEMDISYPGKSQKIDLVERLFTTVSWVTFERFQTSDRPLRSVDLSNILMVTNRQGTWWN
jgi:hypothetical protein